VNEHDAEGYECKCHPFVIMAGTTVSIFHRDRIAQAMDKTAVPLGPYCILWQRVEARA
jgi:hypothetical protein